MYIIFELEELPELVQAVIARTEPDEPIDPAAETFGLKPFDRVAHLLEMLMDEETADDQRHADIKALGEDEEICELAFKILELVTSRLMLRDRIEWFRIIDHHGGLVIHVRPGAK